MATGTLHTVARSPFETAALASCLRVARSGSAVLLLEDGVYAALAGTAVSGDVAAAAGRWILSHTIDTAAGATWPRVPGQDEGGDVGLYHGSPGVVIFLLELHAATGDSDALDGAVRGARELAHRAMSSEPIAPGLYTGLAGMSYALDAVASAQYQHAPSAEVLTPALARHDR